MKNTNLTASFTYLIHSNEVDFKEKLSLSHIVGKLIEVASRHAEQRGFGHADLQRNNHAWVLARLALELNREILLQEQITIVTWVDGYNKRFTTRSFKIMSEHGEVIGYAKSVWSVIDFTTRESVELTPYAAIEQAQTDQEKCPIDPSGRIAPLASDIAPTSHYQVRMSDLDVNAHMTSIKYVEHLVDQFPLAYYQTKRVARFEVHYLQEVRYEEGVSLYINQADDDCFVLEMKQESSAKCRIKLSFK